ncbi:MAG TPA: metallophosphoesterase [Syntrophobacteraceae bacterium]|nr:metallophosphoesterase [Syntrophobacteraceae bacterium]
MARGMNFATIMLIFTNLAVLSQLYLFLRARRAIKSLPGPNLFKFGAIVLVGMSILLLFAANRYIMSYPITLSHAPTAARLCLFYLPAVWTFGSILSALMLFLFDSFTGLGRVIYRIFHNPRRKELSSMNPGRRHFLRVGVSGLASTPFVLSGYGALYAGKAFKVRELALSFGCSLRVVQLTDIHAGIYMTRKDIRQVTDRVNALQPDLLVLTGDYISNSMEFLSGCIEEMARVRAPYGAFATLGNHEHWYGEPRHIQAVFSHYRIPLLQNTHRVIRTARGVFAVAGIDDLRSGHPDLDAALHGLDSNMPVLLLSHRPEIFPQAAAHGIPLTLAGHYHGGQVKLSLPSGDISLAALLTPYPAGLYRSNGSQLYVSSGIGTTFTPVRLNVPPEITLLHLD